jgi:H+-transporting ATPase
VPADARLICDYNSPQDFDVYLRLKEQAKLPDESEPDDEKKAGSSGDEGKKKEKEESAGDSGVGKDEPQPLTQGHAIAACDQSAITGESLAVDKYMGDMVYYTTGCKRGKAYAMAVASAKRSFVGRTAALVEGAKDQGHFKAIMDSIGTTLLVLVMFWILAAWIGGFFRHLRIAQPRGSSINLLHYALILLIIGVPVGSVLL